MAVQPAGGLYDEVPYPGHPFAQTHPDRLDRPRRRDRRARTRRAAWPAILPVADLWPAALILAARVVGETPARNDPCPCGSTKKYTKYHDA